MPFCDVVVWAVTNILSFTDIETLSTVEGDPPLRDAILEV
jgi:hypothetical protein